MHERSQPCNKKSFTFKTLIMFFPLPLFFSHTLSACVVCSPVFACVCVRVCLCTCGCDVDRGRGALPEKSPDNHGYLRGAVGGGHRVCGCLL